MVGRLFHPIKTHAEAFMDQKNWESRKNVLAISKTTDNRDTIARFIQVTTYQKRLEYVKIIFNKHRCRVTDGDSICLGRNSLSKDSTNDSNCVSERNGCTSLEQKYL